MVVEIGSLLAVSGGASAHGTATRLRRRTPFRTGDLRGRGKYEPAGIVIGEFVFTKRRPRIGNNLYCLMRAMRDGYAGIRADAAGEEYRPEQSAW